MAYAAPLRHLDAYLRAIWLECCGHLSRFTIGHAWRGREIPITAKAGQVLRPGVELTHIYDFGTSSETRIRVIGERQGAATSARPIMLMARNDAPELSCMECDRSATALCMECVYEYDRNGMLCEEHAAEHPHEDYGGPLPVVNSPRMGMCGYDGPAEAPYWPGQPGTAGSERCPADWNHGHVGRKPVSRLSGAAIRNRTTAALARYPAGR